MTDYQPGDVVGLTEWADAADEELSFGARGVIAFLRTEPDESAAFRDLCWATPEEAVVVAQYVTELVRRDHAGLVRTIWRDEYR